MANDKWILSLGTIVGFTSLMLAAMAVKTDAIKGSMACCKNGMKIMTLGLDK